MFYSYDILHRRGGKFAIVWLAATKPVKLSKREIFSVNILKTCEDLLDYVCLQGQPVVRGGSVPRLSLYLSSQLMYGLVKVFEKQQHFLMGEAKSLSSRFSCQFPSLDIDLRAMPRAELVTLPDEVRLHLPTEPDFDPYFGLWMEQERIADRLCDLPDIDMFKVNISQGAPAASPVLTSRYMEDIDIPMSPAMRNLPFPPGLTSPYTVPHEKISMLEEPAYSAEIKIPGERDLPTLEGDQLGHLLEQYEDPLRPGLEMAPLELSPRQRSISSQSPSGSEKGERGLTSSLYPHTLDLEEMLAPVEETLVVQGTPLLPPEARVLPSSPGVTPIMPPPAEGATAWLKRKSFELSPITPSPREKRKKRQLLFADAEIQISKKTLRENMDAGHETCRPFTLPEIRPQRPLDLFSKPTTKVLQRPRFLRWWKKNAVTRSQPEEESIVMSIAAYQETAQTSGSSLEGSPRPQPPPTAAPLSPVLEIEEEREASGMQSMEMLRDASTTFERSRQSIHSDAQDSFSREHQDSLSRSKLAWSKGRHPSPLEEALLEEQGYGEQQGLMMEEPLGLDTVLEEQEILSPQLVLPPTGHTQTGLVNHAHVLKCVSSFTAGGESYAQFSHMCPASTNTKTTAALMFASILELCAERKVEMIQEEAFGEMYICRGDRW